MLRNYFKIAIRNLLKRPSLTFINLTGLTLGMVSVVFIYLYVTHETSYDKFHTNYETIHRINWIDENPQTRTPYPMSQALMTDYPEVVSATSLTFIYGAGLKKQTVWMRNPQNEFTFDEKNLLVADSTFFDVFSFEVLSGNKDELLRNPTKFMISQSMAEKYFGDENPVGQVLEVNKEGQFLEVEGVFADVPENSHFHFDFLISYALIQNAMGQDHPYFTWEDFGHFNYVRLQPGASAAALEAQLMNWSTSYLDWNDEMLSHLLASEAHFQVQPITDIHLTSHLRWELEANGNISYVYILSAAGLIILLIASFNFVNLSMARSFDRSNEVGLRKMLGANKQQLGAQFLSESVILSFVAILLSLLIVEVAFPFFNVSFGGAMELSQTLLSEIIALLLILGIITGLLAGAFPAFVLANIQPIQIIGKKIIKTEKGKNFWKLVVGTQFGFTIFLLAGSLIVFNQLNYIQNKELGFAREMVVQIPLRNETVVSRFETLKTELKNIAEVVSVSATSNVPGEQFNQNPMLVTKVPESRLNVSEMWVDSELFETLDLEIVEGRAFSESIVTDSALSFVLNETAANQLSPDKSLIGRQVTLEADGGLRVGTVIGVVKDFNYKSLHEPILPLAIQMLPFYNSMLIRLKTNDPDMTMAKIANIYTTFDASNQFTYSFLDESLSMLYGKEKKLGLIFGIFAAIAILLSCMGIFGLASLSFAKRTKEIGVRKVMGASTSTIIRLLISEFSWIVVIALLFAAPLSLYVMNNWLSNFSYHISLGVWPVVWAFVLTLGVSWITMGWLTIQTARQNPVISLRDE